MPVSAIAEKFIEYYWPQARPYRAVDGTGFVLRQSTGSQAKVLTALVRETRDHSLAAVRRSSNWRVLTAIAWGKLIEDPLWRLQRVGNETDEFLYRMSEVAGDTVRLVPGVPSAFRALYGLVLDAVRGAWVRRITTIPANRDVLANSDLASFLFGDERASLQVFRSLLRDHQQGRCFYCGRERRSARCVDHFIAWSRYPVDLGHNLVLACDGCNNKKRDFLAYHSHLERWRVSHLERASELAQRFDTLKLPHDCERTRAIARWAYEQGEAAGAHAWIDADRFVRLDGTWRDLLGVSCLRLVAEPPPPEYPQR